AGGVSSDAPHGSTFPYPFRAALRRCGPACRTVACSHSRGIDRGMGDQLPDVSVAPPPLLDGIVRVKVPADKILPFLAKSNLFKNCDKTVVSKVATLLQGLECAEGSELVTHGKVNDGIGILFSGKAQVLMPGAGGELHPVEDVEPGG